MATPKPDEQEHTTGSHIYFAIKTCAKFHKERIPIIERTWAADARNRRYYSDVAGEHPDDNERAIKPNGWGIRSSGRCTNKNTVTG